MRALSLIKKVFSTLWSGAVVIDQWLQHIFVELIKTVEQTCRLSPILRVPSIEQWLSHLKSFLATILANFTTKKMID